MVEVVRLNDPKYFKQRLFGFLTKYTSTSCTIKTLKVNGRYRATLTVYGEDETFFGQQNNRRAAEINACVNYINRNVVNQEMTWGFAPLDLLQYEKGFNSTIFSYGHPGSLKSKDWEFKLGVSFYPFFFF
jgi:hypothetical protein